MYERTLQYWLRDTVIFEGIHRFSSGIRDISALPSLSVAILVRVLHCYVF